MFKVDLLMIKLIGGEKKRYKSTYYANKWVSELKAPVANVNAGAAVVAGAIFGLGAFPNGTYCSYHIN